MSFTDADTLASASTTDFVTVRIADQWFGIPVEGIHDVFMPQAVTKVPLARPEVAGVLNLRGRIVTAIDMRHLLDLPPLEDGSTPMAIGIDKAGESYGLVIDEVGEVLSLEDSSFEKNPANLDPRWQQISNGVYRLDGTLLVVLDTARVLAFDEAGQAA